METRKFGKTDMQVSVLGFTLSTPGVDVAIVGTSHPDRWQQNAAVVAQGTLPQEQYDQIRARWQERADQHWLGLV